MAYLISFWAHILVGVVGLLLYWVALLAVKGSDRHRWAGRWFFAVLWVVAFSVGPLLFSRPGPFDPAYVVQFSYLSMCLITVSIIGWTAIRWKHDPERFRGMHFKVLGIGVLVLGVLVFGAGLAQGDPLPTVLAWVGVVYGTAMVRFAWLRQPLHPRWWLNWHLNATCGLFTAVHGTFLFVVWRWLAGAGWLPEQERLIAAAFQVGVLVVAVIMRLWFGRRRGVPLRFAAAPPKEGVVAAS